MAGLKDKDKRFKFLEIKVGVMAAVAIVGIIVIFVLVGMQKDLFTAKYRIYFVSESAAGLKAALPVRLSGFKIGRVGKIELIEEAKVRVTLEINRKYEQWLREGSTARLAKEGLIGDPFIEMSMGDSGGRVLADGEMVSYEKAGGIERLIAEAKPILGEVKELIRYANSPEGGIKVMLGNFKALSGELRETRRSLDKMVSETRALVGRTGRLVEKMDDKGSRLMEKTSHVLDKVDGLTTRLGPVMTRVEGVMERVDRASERLPGVMEKIEGVVDDMKGLTGAFSADAPRMRQLLRDAAAAASDGRQVMGGLKRSWPVRLMMPPVKEPGLVPLDGFVLRETEVGD